jgi:hypothetical protein
MSDPPLPAVMLILFHYLVEFEMDLRFFIKFMGGKAECGL